VICLIPLFIVPAFASHLPVEPLDLSGFPERVDSKCDLAYLMNKLPSGNLLGGEDFVEEYTKLNLEIAKKIEEAPWDAEEIVAGFPQKLKDLEMDSIMKRYSIDPKLRQTVYEISGTSSGVGLNVKTLKEIFALKPELYAEDLECGKKLKADHFKQMYDNVQEFYGKDAADKYGPAIDKAIADAEKNPLSNFQSNGGGCLIATATYGSELAPQVQMLREIRDNSLLQTQSGQSFMESFNSFYYSFSPAIADYERQNPVFKEAVKVTITPLLASLSLLNYVDMDSEESVLGYGIGIILMNVGMYFVAPVIVVSKIRKIKI